MEGGLISSLLLTLIIIPSVFGYVDDFRLWILRISGSEDDLVSGQPQEKAGRNQKKV
jgi:hypothetical protein